MLPNKTTYDTASILGIGRRDSQEDALVQDFPVGAECGFVVLSDGMGGHVAGGRASKTVVTEVFCELIFQRENEEAFRADVAAVLQDAANAANRSVLAQSEVHPEYAGMGATLLAPVFLGDRLHWISIGDSPLYLYRDGRLRQINEDHSLAPQIDLLVERGLMDASDAVDHPDRNCLTSALGSETIFHVDCPAEPLRLQNGDIVLAASDGLQFLPDPEIEAFLAQASGQSSAVMAQGLLARIEALDHPDQDNISLSVVQVSIASDPVQHDAHTSDRALTRPMHPHLTPVLRCRAMLERLRAGFAACIRTARSAP